MAETTHYNPPFATGVGSQPPAPTPGARRGQRCGPGLQEQDAFWAPDEAALTALAETLKQHSIDHEVWTEQPENTATCLALRPYPKDQVHQHLKKFKLLK
ncbi:PREDICTED: putative peptidyl-tRNA hydrolase PTRHD1 [Aptenodytes forsteri]|uniref:putative peptidyl-tRNA hydrolase PTRHD1 n=1 Tax=Aptenodytes forsteri TaxID=9233 RepID=UPI000904ABFA|nr:PREDICTED: putative peptidyl-tRNA hydrolase PTRHD1 [Aptenodytes forsteri]